MSSSETTWNGELLVALLRLPRHQHADDERC
jgi:hypothetical protein